MQTHLQANQNGALFVSAKADITNTTNIGKRGKQTNSFFELIQYQKDLKNQHIIKLLQLQNQLKPHKKPFEQQTSRAPKNAYFELLAHPAIIIP